MTCRSCGRDVPEGVSFCPGCGASVPTSDPGLTAPSPAFKEIPASNDGNNSHGALGLAFGIITLVLSFVPVIFWVAIVTGIIGIYFSSKAMRTAKEAGQTDTMAILGLTFSIVGLVISAIFTIPLAIVIVVIIVYLVICIIVGVISFILSLILMFLPLFALPFM